MDFQALFQQFLSGGVAHQASTFRSLVIFSPELVLSCSIVLMLLARLKPCRFKAHLLAVDFSEDYVDGTDYCYYV